MPTIKISLLWLVCAIDFAIGASMAGIFGFYTRIDGFARMFSSDNAAYILFTVLALCAPVLVLLMRGRTSYTNRFMLAALPISLFFAFGGQFSVRFR